MEEYYYYLPPITIYLSKPDRGWMTSEPVAEKLDGLLSFITEFAYAVRQRSDPQLCIRIVWSKRWYREIVLELGFGTAIPRITSEPFRQARIIDARREYREMSASKPDLNA